MVEKLTRRIFLKRVSSLLVLLFFKGRLHAACRTPSLGEMSPDNDVKESAKSIGRKFAGEELKYNLSFLWFKKAATCIVNFQALPEKGRYQATIKGQTHGLIGMVTRFRQDILTALMEEVDRGKRFRPLEFREDVVIGTRHRKKVTHFDYHNQQVIITKERKNTVRQKSIAIPKGETYYDPITGCYNFRFGSFGPIERGRRFLIKTVPKKNFTCIRLTVASEEEERKHGASSKEKVYFVFAEIDKDIIRSKSGKVEGWFSSDLVPTEGSVKDVVWFGDIVGKLKEHNTLQG